MDVIIQIGSWIAIVALILFAVRSRRQTRLEAQAKTIVDNTMREFGVERDER